MKLAKEGKLYNLTPGLYFELLTSVCILGFLLLKHVHCIGGHLFLCYEQLLGPVDDKVPPRVKGTLVQFRQVTICESAKQTVGGAKHDGDLSDEGLCVLLFHWLLVLSLGHLGDVHIEGGGVSEVPEASLVRHERDRGTVLLPVGWLREVDLLKFQGIFGLEK